MNTKESPLEQVRAHLRQLAARSMAAVDLPPAERQATLRAVMEDYGRVSPSAMEVDARVTPVQMAGRPAEWLEAATSLPERRMLYVHGGSWSKGSLDSHRPLVGRIAAAARCTVLAVDYRLAPEHPFPAGLEDCAAALAWVREHGPGGPSPAGRVLLAGDSAGGNLALAALLLTRQRGHSLPDGVIALSPAVDFTGSSPSVRTRAKLDPLLTPETFTLCAMVYLQHGEDLRDPLVSPLYGDLRGLPPMLLQVGTAEILLDDSRRFAEAAQQAGVDVTLQVYPHMPHVFQFFAPFLPEATTAIQRIGDFVESCCTSSPR